MIMYSVATLTYHFPTYHNVMSLDLDFFAGQLLAVQLETETKHTEENRTTGEAIMRSVRPRANKDL